MDPGPTLTANKSFWLMMGILTFLTVPDIATHYSTTLNDYVSHFEFLDYDAVAVQRENTRHKRSMPQDHHQVLMDFFSHGRRFQLDLKRDFTAFGDRLEVIRGDHTGRNDESITEKVDTSQMYHGTVRDDPGSYCFGSIREGVFDGQIVTNGGTYYVERSHKHLKTDVIQEIREKEGKSHAHSVIYHEKNIQYPINHHRNVASLPGCGVSYDTQRWMESIQNSASLNSSRISQSPSADETYHPFVPEARHDEVVIVDPAHKYSKKANAANSPLPRVKRAARENPNKRKSCSLYIQTDPLFWRHIREQEEDDAKTEEEILSLIAQHVKAVNRIYSDTPFDGKYKHNGYQFEVQRIKIHNDSKCEKSQNSAEETRDFKTAENISYTSQHLKTSPNLHPFCIPNVDVSNFLNLHSQYNHEEFCLAYVFTYRDFTGGTLGLAWVASASGASGGICETYKRYTENIDGVHRTAKRSLNTGIITFVNYNSRVPPKVSQLTLAHEIGHNFGSPHDWPEDCRPGGVEGNYIMFASATSGDRHNNNKFSHCSKSNISAVLDAITDGRKPNCFTESNGAFCGNKIVEEGEECDCGFDDHECAEQCCFPRKSADLSEEENKRNRCRRREDTQCSPSEGPCCNNRCRFISKWEKIKCKGNQDCTKASFCDGNQAQCPIPAFKEDNVTECNEGTQVCQEGECKSSICVKYNLESCFLTSDSVKDKRQLCELACRKPNNNTCMSTRDLVEQKLILDLEEGLSLRPGSPCDNFQGYCDVFLKCRKVDAEGPLVRLKNLIFNQENLITIAQWVTEFWWAVLLMGITFVIFMAIFIRCCAIHTPSSNPNLPKNLQFSETLRRPVRSLQKQHYRQANSGSRGIAPPPYPGRGGENSTENDRGAGVPSGVPGHGYGEGRGHYNRSRGYEPSTHRQDTASAIGNGSHGGRSRRNYQENLDRQHLSASHGSSRLEMQPMR